MLKCNKNKIYLQERPSRERLSQLQKKKKLRVFGFFREHLISLKKLSTLNSQLSTFNSLIGC